MLITFAVIYNLKNFNLTFPKTYVIIYSSNEGGNPMKKTLLILVTILLVCSLALCGCNRAIGPDLTQTFRWGIIQLGNGELIEGTVESWRDFENSDVVQVKINGITYLTHYSNVILTTAKP